MLRLYKSLSIQNDVFSKIPREQLRMPAVSGEGAAAGEEEAPRFLDMKSSRLALVGQEDDGILLFAHDGYAKDASGKASKRTFINMYDMKTRELTTLFMHDYVIDVVSCSVNEERTLLVFTTLSRYRKPVPNVTETQDFEELYESRLVEVLSQRSMPIDKLSKSRQSVYFLGSDAKQKGWTRRRVFLLFVMHTHFAQVLHIQTTRRGPTDERVLKFAELFAKLVQKSQLAWHQYNAKEKTLYCLVAQNNKGTYDKNQDYTLRCYKLSGDRRNDVLFEVGPLQLAHEQPETPTTRMSMQLPGEARAGHRRSASQSFDARAAAATMSVKWTDNLQIVEMNGNAVCLCQQHPVEPNAFSPSINVSIFVLHHKLKLDFSIPMNGPNDAAYITTARVFFDCIGDMLLVYVPGRYIQLIDCGDEHDPCPNLFFTGSKFATLLPDQSVEDFPPFVMPFDTMMSTSDYRRYGMLDVLKGVLYEYTFNREAVLNVFDLPSSDWHVYALHLAIVHMNDVELVDKIMRHMCSTRPEMVSTVLIKEYLIGTPYLSVKNKNMEAHLLSLLPVTSLESFSSDNLSKKIKRFITTSRLNIPVLASNRKLIRPTNRQRFVSGGSGVLPSVEPGNNAPTFRNLFMRILGIDEGQNTGTVPTPPPPPPDTNVLATNPSSAIDRWKFVEALADYMFNSFPKETKSKCLAWAKDYRGEQIHQSNRLYEYIAESTAGFVRLQVMENLYYILEELSFPAPKGFTTEFASLGYKYLPRSVFMQYMERGVFHITEAFATELFASLKDTPEDHEFKFAIISKLPIKEFIRTLQKHPEFYQLLLEYFHSTLPIKFPSFQDLLNPRFIEKSNQQLQSTNNSFFLPVSIFLADLNSNYHLIMSGGSGDGATNVPGGASPLVSPRSPAIFVSPGGGPGSLHGTASVGGIPIFATSGQHATSGLASSSAGASGGGSNPASASAVGSSSSRFSIFGDTRPPPPPPPPPAHADGVGPSGIATSGMYTTSVIRKVGFVNEHLMPTIRKAFERTQPLATPTAAVTYNKKKSSSS